MPTISHMRAIADDTTPPMTLTEMRRNAGPITTSASPAALRAIGRPRPSRHRHRINPDRPDLIGKL
jgi:hypothetical protein